MIDPATQVAIQVATDGSSGSGMRFTTSDLWLIPFSLIGSWLIVYCIPRFKKWWK